MADQYESFKNMTEGWSTNPLVQMGLGIMGSTGSAGQMMARGMSQGMTNVTRQRALQQEALYRQTMMAQAQAKMAAQRRAEAVAEQRRQAQAQYIGGLPPDQQALAGAFPEAYAKGEIGKKFRDPNVNRETFGVTPRWGVDADGNPVMLQLSNRGGVTAVTPPPGVTPLTPGKTVDLGDRTIVLDEITGNPRVEYKEGIPPAQEPEFKAKQAEETAVGGARGAERATAITQYRNLRRQLEAGTRQIDALLAHPGRTAATGVESIFPTFAGGQAAGFEERLEQLKGGAYEQAYETLKGAGQITEFEAATVAKARARLALRQSDEEFANSLREYRDEMLSVLETATARYLEEKQRAGGQDAPQAAAVNPRAEELRKRIEAAERSRGLSNGF